MAKSSLSKHIYGICGVKFAGKDTFAKLVLKNNPNYTIIHFADDLKKMASEIFDLTWVQMNDPALKESKITPIVMDNYLSQMRSVTGIDVQPKGLTANTPREALQFFGTDYIRSMQSNYWINRTADSILRAKRQVLIPDTRFLNEAEVIRKLGGKIIRVARLEPRVGTQDLHPSEVEQTKIVPDVTLMVKTGDLTLSEAASFNLAKGRWRFFAQFDYTLFETAKKAYIEGATLEEVGNLIGRKHMGKKGLRGVFHKLLVYYNIPMRHTSFSLREKHEIIDHVENKRCSKCKAFKPLLDFNYSSASWDSLNCHCRSCQSDMNKHRYNNYNNNTLKLIFTSSKKQAKCRSIDFSITLEDIETLWSYQNGRCWYTNKPMDFIKKSHNRVTIDRVDSLKGYTPDNVVLASYRANIMKNSMSVADFVHTCSEVVTVFTNKPLEREL